MKCTYDEAVKGYMALLGLRKNRIPGDVAKIFFALRKKLKDAVDFETEQETQYVEDNGGKVAEGTGKVTFDEPDKLIGFLNKQTEIRALEFEYEAPGKYVVDPAVVGMISDEDMENLAPFIDWVY